MTVFAQNKSTGETRALIKKMSGISQSGVQANQNDFMSRYPIQRDGKGSKSIAVLAKVNGAFNKGALESEGIKITSRVADIVCMRVPIDKLTVLETAAGIDLYSVAHNAYPMMDNTRQDTRTDSIQAGEGVPQPFNGEGVLIGITDWGFDYTHPNINAKNNPRILRAWDQFKNSGPAPEGFDYGTEHVGDSALRAVKCDTSGLYGHGTHGTHVAGICGGNGYNGHAIGQAPGAKFLLGSWYLNEAAWLDQAAWMYRVAKEEGKRLVINGSWGMYTFSTLDGTSLLSQAMNAYADSGVVFVTSGGNNGNDKFHIGHTFDGDTIHSIAQWYGSGIGQGLIYWGEPGADKQFSVGFGILRGSNMDNAVFSPMYSTADDVEYTESYIIVDGDTVHYDLFTESANPLDNRPHALLNVEKTSGKLVMVCTAADGATVHIWNMTNLANGAGNMGCDFAKDNVSGCMNGDANYGIGEPGCAEKTLTIAAHYADRRDDNGNWTLGDIATFSSYGPTLDGRAKPDISAPGVNVVSSISSYYDGIEEYNQRTVYRTISSGRAYIWAAMSGTSMSSPAVAGIVALMLQANPYLMFDDIRNIIISTARNDEMTGPLSATDSISPRWGHGKIDALKAVNAAWDMLDIDQAIANQPSLVVFPNPTTDHVTVRTGSNMPETASIYSVDGKMVKQQTISSEASIDISTLPQGVYFIRLQGRAGVRSEKIVKH